MFLSWLRNRRPRSSPYQSRLRLEQLEDRCLLTGGITVYPLPTPYSVPGNLVSLDGYVWFTESYANKIGRLAMDGTLTEFPLGPAPAGSDASTNGPWGLTAGPDGNLWFTENFGPIQQIGRMNPLTGVVTQFPLNPLGSQVPDPRSITAGPDGNLWFTELQGNAIGRITTGGQISLFPVLAPFSIVVGPDGNLWFTQSTSANEIGRINPSTGVITEFQIGSTNQYSGTDGITAGPGGAIWFTMYPNVANNQTAGAIGQLDPNTGAVTLSPIPELSNPSPTCITVGADGNLWFTDTSHSILGRMTPTGQFTEYPLSIPGSVALFVTTGPDGNMWFSSDPNDNYIGRLFVDRPLAATGQSIACTEGGTFSGVVASFTDADPLATPGSYTALINWGDGSVSAGVIGRFPGGGFDVIGTHPYADAGILPVSVTITDVDTFTGDVGQNTVTATSTALVTDAPLSAVGVNPSGLRAIVNAPVAVFTDAGGAESVSNYLATIDWGDGSQPIAGAVTLQGTLLQVLGSHLYLQNGTYTVTVTISDEGGATTVVSSQAVVASLYPLDPAQIRHAYGFDGLGLRRNDGRGETIAIVDAYDNPTIFQDLDTFDQTYGVTAGRTLYQQYGASTQFLVKTTPEGMPAPDAGWSQEIALDVEWTHAIAPGARILLVEAKSNSMTDQLSAVDFASSIPGVVVVSMSWGSAEFSGETQLDSHFQHPGITYVASAGDTGSTTSWPAMSPNVLSVGGTSLTVDAAGKYLGETGWSKGGGGVSSYEPKPPYQKWVPQSGSQRTGPDVAYAGDPNTGFAIFDSSGGGGWQGVGGTSAGAPQWSALIAIADERRATPLDTATVLKSLYAQLSRRDKINGTYFHDVTSGSSGLYSAAAGYDLVTGLGSPRANKLIPYLRGVPMAVVPPSAPAALGAPTTTNFDRTLHLPISDPLHAATGTWWDIRAQPEVILPTGEGEPAMAWRNPWADSESARRCVEAGFATGDETGLWADPGIAFIDWRRMDSSV